MKLMAKRMLVSSVLRLPWGAREAIFKALWDRLGNAEVLVRAASEAGITGFTASGQWGLFQSASTDRYILPVYARTGNWATRTYDMLTRFFGEAGGTYLDIGANIGLTTIPIARNPQVSCFAFEPEPTNFANLQENVRRNVMFGNVNLHQLALLDRRGAVPFGLAEDGNLGDHRVVTSRDQGRRTIDVEAVPLDSLDLPVAGRLAVKIDTQGAEPLIIAGGRATLAKAGLAILEFSPFLIDQLGGDPGIVIDYVGTFERVALVKGESDAELVFMPATTACAQLRDMFEQSRGNESEYFDIYAEKTI